MQRMRIAAAVLVAWVLFWSGSDRGRMSRIPPELKGSPASLARQNSIANQRALLRIRTDSQLDSLVSTGYLMVVPDSTLTFFLDPKEVLPQNRFLLPFAKAFLEEFAGEHFKRFPRPLRVVSLVRSETYHWELVRNGITDADARVPERRSVHPTGAAFDISKLHLPRQQVDWLREYLVAAERASLVEATEELENNNFHIFVVPPNGFAVSPSTKK